MVNESALRDQRLESIQEVDGDIPADAHYIPFADVVDSIDWTPDVPINPRRGVGSVDQQKFDRGQETHSFSMGYNLQGAIAAADVGGGNVNAEPVLEAIVRTTNNALERRTVVLREVHAGEGVAGAGRHIYSVARHCVPNSLVFSGDPAANSPVGIELEYMAPKVRTYILDQPGTADTIDIASNVSGENGDIKIRGLSGGSPLTETVTVSSSAATTSNSFSEIYEIEVLGTFDGDLTFSMTGTGNTVFKVLGAVTYWNVEGDKGIPVVPSSGSRVTEHGGTEQRFLSNVINFNTQSIAERINSFELEIANNVDSQGATERLGEVLEAGARDITATATVFGKKASHTSIDRQLRKVVGDLVWNLDLNTITATNATITDTGSRARDEGNVFANVDAEFTGKSITVT